MKKDIEWLKKEIGTEMIELEPNREERWSDVKYQTLRNVAQKIYQLDEPEVLSQEWIDKNVINIRGLGDIFEAVAVENLIVPKQESEVLSQEESINIVLDDLKEYIKEQQSLSQNVGLAHTFAGNDTHYRQYDYVLECVNEYEPSDDLQNLLIPKQEVLSQEWIDRNKFEVNGWNEAVHVEDLQNLLVPKQELPVIPEYVAEYLEFAKDKVKLMKVLEVAYTRDELHEWKKVYDWISANDEVFARAWLDGHEVEEEQKYYVDLYTAAYVAKWNINDQVGVYSDGVSGSGEHEFHLTEQEIKDCDERFWPFAVKVEEDNNE